MFHSRHLTVNKLQSPFHPFNPFHQRFQDNLTFLPKISFETHKTLQFAVPQPGSGPKATPKKFRNFDNYDIFYLPCFFCRIFLNFHIFDTYCLGEGQHVINYTTECSVKIVFFPQNFLNSASSVAIDLPSSGRHEVRCYILTTRKTRVQKKHNN